jgi:adenine-specific DNA methylase
MLMVLHADGKLVTYLAHDVSGPWHYVIRSADDVTGPWRTM